MREIRRRAIPYRARAAHRVARDADAREEHLLPAQGSPRGSLAGRALEREPAREFGLGLGVHDQAHPRVLDPAEFGARAFVRARFAREQTQVVGLSRDHVALAGERGHPEIVDDVGGIEVEIDGHAHRHVELVCRHRASFEPVLPPELVRDDRHVQRGTVAPSADRQRPPDLTHGADHQDEHDRDGQERCGRPSDLQAKVARDLARERRSGPIAKTRHGDDQEADDEEEDRERDRADDEREVRDGFGGGPHRAVRAGSKRRAVGRSLPAVRRVSWRPG